MDVVPEFSGVFCSDFWLMSGLIDCRRVQREKVEAHDPGSADALLASAIQCFVDD
jgi:hypothetical protein